MFLIPYVKGLVTHLFKGGSIMNKHVDNVTPAAPLSIHHAARGFSQSFGLHPAVALLTIAVDAMLFGEEAVTLGLGWPFSVAVSAAVGFLSYRAQMRFYNDDHEAAMIKSGILALLCAIPTALPALLYLPAGALGLFRGNKN